MSKKSKRSKLARIDPEFEDDLMKAMKVRFTNGLCDSKDINMREATALLRRTTGGFISLEELKSKPKKRK